MANIYNLKCLWTLVWILSENRTILSLTYRKIIFKLLLIGELKLICISEGIRKILGEQAYWGLFTYIHILDRMTFED